MGGQVGRSPPKVGSPLPLPPKVGPKVGPLIPLPLKVGAGVGGEGVGVGAACMKVGAGVGRTGAGVGGAGARVGGAGARVGGAGAGVGGAGAGVGVPVGPAAEGWWLIDGDCEGKNVDGGPAIGQTVVGGSPRSDFIIINNTNTQCENSMMKKKRVKSGHRVFTYKDGPTSDHSYGHNREDATIIIIQNNPVIHNSLFKCVSPSNTELKATRD
jgi:hypothetical protein